ncbi:MAG: outer membrane beta-barrel protein [Bacteroidetes bacterium]|nr:outer membrane beta-barrel protein [Bacteroidota bacterium]
MKKLITAILILLFSGAAFAQRSDVGIFIGSSYYTGDLNPGKPFNKPLPAYGALYRYNFNPRIAIKAGLTFTQFQGADKFSKFQPDRGLYFNSTLVEGSAQLEVSFYEFKVDGDDHSISPYIFAGIGYSSFKVSNSNNPYVTLASGDIQDVTTFTVDPKNPIVDNPQDNVNKSLPLPNIPFGLGIKYNPFENVSMGLEWGLRKPFGKNADKLDNVYQQGIRVSTANDWYAFAGFWIAIRLNIFNNNSCDEFKRH